MGKKAVISEERVACSLYYLGNVLQAMCGPIVFIQNLSIFSFSVGFSENQRHLELVSYPGDTVMSSIYLKMGERAVISEERVDPLSLLLRQRFKGYVRAYCFDTKHIHFLVFCTFF